MSPLLLFYCILLTWIGVAHCDYYNFNGCDYFETIEMGRTYDVFSPYYPNKYMPGSVCRWSGCAPSGTYIVINCTVVQIPTYTGCDVNGDRLEVSFRGCQELNDATNHCTQPFVMTTYSNALVMALKSKPNSIGGKFFCQAYAQQGAQPSPQPVSPARYGPVTPFPQQNTYIQSRPQQQLQPIYQPAYQPNYPSNYQPGYQTSYQSNYQRTSYQQSYPAYQQQTYFQQPIYSRPIQAPAQPVPYPPATYQQSNVVYQNGFPVTPRPSNYPTTPTFTPTQQVWRPMAPTNTPQCECGARKRPRLVNGENIDIEFMPFTCGLIDLNTKGLICGCMIINQNFITTAAHCLANRTIDTIGVIVGTTNYERPFESQYAATYQLMATEIHGGYDSVSMLNDIALARTTPIQFSQAVQPVCLPISQRLSEHSYEFSKVEATGYGQTSLSGPPSKNLQIVTLDVISKQQCNENYPYQITDSQICTLTPGKDTCNLDDGTGLCHTDTLTGRSVLIGIPSYGVGCGTRLPRVSTRVSNYIPWIMQTTKEPNSFCVI